MKIRSCFVANSSSASFILIVKEDFSSMVDRLDLFEILRQQALLHTRTKIMNLNKNLSLYRKRCSLSPEELEADKFKWAFFNPSLSQVETWKEKKEKYKKMLIKLSLHNLFNSSDNSVENSLLSPQLQLLEIFQNLEFNLESTTEQTTFTHITPMCHNISDCPDLFRTIIAGYVLENKTELIDFKVVEHPGDSIDLDFYNS